VHLVVPPGGVFRDVRRIELGPRTLSIGRGEACDVRLDVAGVDAEHAKISEVALIALGPDIAIGDVPLDQGGRRLISPGDEIQIGSVVVALEGRDPQDTRTAADAQEVGALGRPRPQGPKVRVVEGENFGEELVLAEEGRDYVVGRHAEADLVLDDREVSREHIKVRRQGWTVYVRDSGSTRGSYIGRSPLYGQDVKEWQRPRMLRLGATVLSLDLPEEVRLSATPAPVASGPMTPESRSPAVPAASSDPSGVSRVIGSPPSSAAAPAVAPSVPATAASNPVLMPVAAPSRGGPARTAWKRSGPTIGRFSGLLLLGLAGLAILGALFVVFTLLE
jgi:pSer/pThr/pTyr-binding forkhead associated (FHA) protein